MPLKAVLLTQLPISLVGVTTVGIIRIPAYIIDQQNFVCDG